MTDPAVAKMIANLEANTGRSLADWVETARACGEQKHGAIVKHLKAEQGLTHGYANLVAHEALQSAAAHQDDTDLIAQQYAGKKAGLQPLYEQLVTEIRRFGGDVELAPKKAYVSLRRSKQFGLLQPSTATRLDVGLNLKGVEPTDALEASGSFNAMCTHRVRISSAADITPALLGWLRQAYEAA